MIYLPILHHKLHVRRKPEYVFILFVLWQTPKNLFQTQRDYIIEYVSWVDMLLKASFTCEALANENKQCTNCHKGNSAVWRCKDCSLGLPMCRHCMRKNHKENPFHWIEKWNGHFFRSADLWEVGTYLLIRHHIGKLHCDIILIRRKVATPGVEPETSCNHGQVLYQLSY